MYLSPERMAIANQAIIETFENTSVAWQAIPHWDTGNPGQSRVRNDVVDSPGFLIMDLEYEYLQVTLVQTSAPTSDSLIAEINSATTKLAQKFDAKVLAQLHTAADSNVKLGFILLKPDVLLDNLIDARAKVEDAGYRAPSCLITNTKGLKELSALDAGYPITGSLLDAAHVNSLHRTSRYDELLDAYKADGTVADDGKKPPKVIAQPGTVMVMLGRRQLIAHGAAPDASPGEEPVDIAVSEPPSLEVVGETTNSQIELSLQIRFVLRVKDNKSLVSLYGNPEYVP